MNIEPVDLLQLEYNSVKDFSQIFLTVIAAVLVFSVTFCDKILNLQTASDRTKIYMKFAWMFLLIGCAAAIGSLLEINDRLRWGEIEEIKNLHTTHYFIMASGVALMLGLFCLVVASVSGLSPKSK